MILQYSQRNSSMHITSSLRFGSHLVIESFRTYVRLLNLLRCFYSYISPLDLPTGEPHSHSLFLGRSSIFLVDRQLPVGGTSDSLEKFNLLQNLHCLLNGVLTFVIINQIILVNYSSAPTATAPPPESCRFVGGVS